MKRIKRIGAWCGIILLLGLYLATFIAGISGRATKELLMACVICTVLVPVLFYAVALTAKVLRKDDPEDSEE